MTIAKLKNIIKSKSELDQLPVIVNADFGHTEPKITFPIGGNVEISANKKHCIIRITEH